MRGTYRINEYLRKRIAKRYQQYYEGAIPTLFCNNRTGAMMLHDLGMRFNSPFVNLWIEPDDFLAICANPEAELSNELVEVDSELDYPVAELNGKKIYFQHYESFNQANEIWKRRLERVDYANISILFVLRDHYSTETIDAFASLPQKHKVMLVGVGHDVVDKAIALPKSSDSTGCLEILTDYSGLSGRRYYDEFDFPAWFSNSTIRLSD